MEPDPREPTGDHGYDMAHADIASGKTGGRPASPGKTPQIPDVDDGAGDYGYDEAHDFRR